MANKIARLAGLETGKPNSGSAPIGGWVPEPEETASTTSPEPAAPPAQIAPETAENTASTTSALPAAVPVLPPVPSELRYVLDAMANPHPDIPVHPTVIANFQEVSRAALVPLAPMMHPASPATVTAWLWPINGAVAIPLGEDDFKRRVAGLVIAAGSVPGCAWTAAAQRRGLAVWRYFPSVSEVVDLVMSDVAPLVSRWMALQAIAHR